MNFSQPPRATRPESIVAMINVVFLLLIFFLMTSQLAPPDPFEITPPDAASDGDSEADLTLYLGEDGALWFDGVAGDGALDALAASSRVGDAAVRLRADAGGEAATLAALLRRLAAAGITQVDLMVAPK